MAVEYHVATFFYDGATTNRWVRDVGPRGRIRPQSVEEFMGMVSDDETNAVVISVTDRPDQQVQSRTTPTHISISSNHPFSPLRQSF